MKLFLTGLMLLTSFASFATNPEVERMKKQLFQMRFGSAALKSNPETAGEVYKQFLTDYKDLEFEMYELAISFTPEELKIRSEHREFLQTLRDRNCEYIVSGKNNKIESDWGFYEINHGHAMQLNSQNTLSARESLNPLLRNSSYAGYYVFHELAVEKGEAPNTINLKLSVSCPQRGGPGGSLFSCDKPTKSLKNVPLENLSVKFRWEVTNTVQISCK